MNRPSHSHMADKGLGLPALLPLAADLTPVPTPTLTADVAAEFYKLQWLWPIPQLPTSFLPQKQQEEGKKGTITPKLLIWAAPQFISKLNSQHLSLAHNQMITQGFTKRREVVELASPPQPPPSGRGSHIIHRKRCTCFQRRHGVKRARKES